MRSLLLVFFSALVLTACSGDPGTGPVDVKWDRDVCERCTMVLSDREHSAQIRYTPAEGRSKVHTFDDLGCAILWLDKQPWRNESSVELWVNDYQNGRWIDARKAHYITGRITPMQYGLGAQTEAIAGTLNFDQAREHVYRIERQFNIHGGNLEHAHAIITLPPIDGAPGRTQDR